MLISDARISNYPVLSLHIGGEIARIISPIVDPNDLKIIAFFVSGAIVRGEEVGNILKTDSIREISKLGIIVDSADEFVEEGDVIRIDEILGLNFSPIGLKVESKKGSNLGKVIGYMINTENFLIQQVIVKRPMIKSFMDSELLIGRSEIVEVTDYKIIVRDEEDKIRQNAMKKDFVPDFVNPFREQRLATAESRIPDEPNTQ